MHEVLVNRLGGLSLPRKSVVRLTDRPNMTLHVYHGRKTTMQQQSQLPHGGSVAYILPVAGCSPVLRYLNNSHSCTVLSNILPIC